jgi:tRNA pseudouridine55 synthase
MTSGVVLVNKPAGMSSAHVVGRVKRLFRGLRVGHAGTLDPFATGLLVCLVGRATRLTHYVQDGIKTYSGLIKFGIETDSDDITGSPLDITEKLPTYQACLNIIPSFLGKITQIPPKISAIHLNGKRAYQLVRSGQEVIMPPRQVHIYDLDLSVPPNPERVLEVGFRVTCSKGTYIRALARDLGRAVQSRACLKTLCREASQPFSSVQAHRLDELTHSSLQCWTLLFPDVPRIAVSLEESAALAGGDQRNIDNIIARQNMGFSSKLVVYSDRCSGDPLGLLVRKDEMWHLGIHIAAEGPVGQSLKNSNSGSSSMECEIE